MKMSPSSKIVSIAAILICFRGGIDGILPTFALAQVSPVLVATDGEALLKAAQAEFKNKRYQEAIALLEKATVIFESQNNLKSKVTTLKELGNCYFSLTERAKAINYYQKSLELARKINDRYGEVNALSRLGYTYYTLDKYDEAIDYLQKSLEIARKIGNLKLEGSILINLGNLFQKLEKYQAAIDYHQQALILFRKLADPQNEGKTCKDLGDLYSRIGKYQLAIDYHQKSLEIFRKTSNSTGEGTALGELGYLSQLLGKNREAIAYHEQALEIFRRTNNSIGQANSFNDLGNISQKTGDDLAANNYFQQALQIYRQQNQLGKQAPILIGLGNVAAGQNRDREAIDRYKEALQIARQLKYQIVESAVLNNLGIMSRKSGRYQEAIDYHQQALEISRKLGNKPNEGSNIANIGISEYRRRRPSVAVDYLQRASEITDALRLELSDADRVSLFETQLYYYKLLTAARVLDRDFAGSLISIERGRARIFAELLSKRLSNSSSPTQASVPTFEQIQAQARSRKATIVSYSILQDYDLESSLKPYEKPHKLLIHVISPLGKLTVRESLIPKDFKLAGSIEANHSKLLAAATTSAREHPELRQLHQLLIAPIADLLPTDPLAPTIFVPDGALYEVPFAALQDERGRYLIDTHTISIAPSLSVLAQTAKLKQRNNDPSRIALIVGNPDFDRRYGQLTYSQQEAQTIAKLLPSKLFVGTEATGVAVKRLLPQARVAHFATHGFMDNDRGLNSRVVFAASNGDTGVLTADKVLDLKLQADLVVLSACDTGRGQITGDGVIGLSRSFIAAGASSTIVSLWQVNDRSTAELMTDFYRQWLGGKPKAQALRQAMLNTKAKYPDPYFWASMSLYGENE